MQTLTLESQVSFVLFYYLIFVLSWEGEGRPFFVVFALQNKDKLFFSVKYFSHTSFMFCFVFLKKISSFFHITSLFSTRETIWVVKLYLANLTNSFEIFRYVPLSRVGRHSGAFLKTQLWLISIEKKETSSIFSLSLSKFTKKNVWLCNLPHNTS